MGPHYRAYLLRHWQLPDGQERVEVQYVATGEHYRCHSLSEATAWLTTLSQARAPNAPVSAPTLGAGVASGAHTTMDEARDGATDNP